MGCGWVTIKSMPDNFEAGCRHCAVGDGARPGRRPDPPWAQAVSTTRRHYVPVLGSRVQRLSESIERRLQGPEERKMFDNVPNQS